MKPHDIDSLFFEIEEQARSEIVPLAARMRPRTLDEFMGQSQVVGPGTWLRQAIESDSLSSIVLFGPAGTGKTSLARIIAHVTQAEFVEVSAVSGTVADLRREIDAASERLSLYGRRTILFIDEIHRFSRSQQDALLHAVEDRTVVMVGATTENPFFEVNSALLSRSRVIELTALRDEQISTIIIRALVDERGLDDAYCLTEEALDAIVLTAGGDARMALTTLELAAGLAGDGVSPGEHLLSSHPSLVPGTKSAGTLSGSMSQSEPGAKSPLVSEARLELGVQLEQGPPLVPGTEPAGTKSAVGTGSMASSPEVQPEPGTDPQQPEPGTDPQQPDLASANQTQPEPGTHVRPRRIITLAAVQQAVPHRSLPYDKKADMHYDVISAFIKSMRGSDPDAAVYWLARMIEGGEDPRFIARRIFILASEDIGNADPNALLIAEAAFKAAEVIGYPECRINLAQAAIYMALAPKSNAAITAIDAAQAEVRNGPLRNVPSYLRDRHRPGAETYGAYRYPHSYPGGWVDQRYLPEGLERGSFYTPSPRGWEAYRTEATARDRGRVPGTQEQLAERRSRQEDNSA